jgi:hypothetical protein
MPLARATRITLLTALLATSALGSAAASRPIDRVAAPPDFERRFLAVCGAKGFPEARCRCHLDVVLEHVSDENLELILNYFEDPRLFSERIAELEIDEDRAESLREEIEDAVAAGREECGTRR